MKEMEMQDGVALVIGGAGGIGRAACLEFARPGAKVVVVDIDAFLPMGPAITTADEIPDPQSLDISLTIGGVVLQKSNTRELVFGVQQLVHLLSGIMTLDPGDVVSTGTPSGVGAARTPKRWILPGETVTVEIAKLGILSKPVVKES